MNKLRLISFLGMVAAFLAGTCPVSAQQSFIERFSAHNTSMTKLQPALITPLMSPDPRIMQYAKFSFANSRTSAGTETTSYGNGKGFGVIAGKRYEFDYIPPAYLQHNSTALDGFGDMGTFVKYRIASGNADHGNYIVTAMLGHTFATGSHKNGATTDSYGPMLGGGYAFRHFAAISSLGGTMPTGKIAAQGRSIGWNNVLQMHATKYAWLEIENNSCFYFSGSHDGKVQNFLTPAAFYVVRRKEWKPTHPFLIFDAGIQIATSAYHSYNHNAISEMRLVF